MSSQTIGDILNFVSQRLGIGTTNPQSLLDVAGILTTLTSTTSNLNVYNTAYISNSLGIGTTIARKALDIQGDINIGGTIYQNNSVYISSQWGSNNNDGTLYYLNSVGIGTTAPLQTLDVGGTIRGNGLTGGLISDSTSTTSSTVAASMTAVKSAYDTATGANNNANTRVLKTGDTMTGNLIVSASIGIGTLTPLQAFHVEGQTYISSNVGIGTNIAKRTLDVQGDINFAGSLFQNNSLYISSQWTSNLSANSLYYTGSVGIGSTQPIQALDIAGDIRANNLTINSSIITSNLTVLGTETIVNTYTTYTSNLRIDNQLGDGPALVVLQKGVGSQYAVADFYDRDVSTTIPALRVAEGGNIGIGTINPLRSLHVQGDVYASGSVGIGSTQPIQALDVAGTIRGSALTGTLISDSISTTSSTVAASATAVKTAYDTANSNANTRVLKTGDTMTGNLILNAKIGINTGTPLQPLHVQGQAFITSNLGIGSAGSNAFQALTVYGQSYFSSNMGIGTTQPVYPLDVVGTIRGSALTGSLITDSISTSNSTVAASASAAKTAFDTAFSANSNADSRVSKWGDTMIGNLILNAKIGINTGTPLQPLHVQGQAFITSNLGIGSAGSNAFQALTVYGQSYFSSNMGIGTTFAKRTLDVQGDINFSGGLYQNNALYISSQWTSNTTTNSLYYNGSVGIGSTQPRSALDVAGTIYGTNLTISNSIITSNLTVQGQAFITSNLGIGLAGSNAFQPLTVYGQSYFSSNMGIGTTFAKRTLDVQGDINFSGGLYQNNALYISSQWTSNTSTNSLYYNGNVGIGSTQPRSALDVAGIIYGTNLTISNSIITSNLTVQGTQTIINTYTTYTSNLTIDNQLGSGPALMVLQKGLGGQYPVADFYDRDVSTTVPAFRIADGGYVGVGTALPLQPLHVQGQAFITSNLGIGSAGSNAFQTLTVYGRSYFSSNVGIGNTQPVYPLDVVGTIRGSALTGSLITDSISTSNSTVAASASAAKTAFDTAFSANSNADSRVSKWGDTMIGNLILNAKIGINTGTPLQPLHVQGQAFITSNLGIGSAGSNAFQTLTVYGRSYFSSNVGIGNTQPVYPLDVVGTIRGSALTGSLITDSISTSNSTVAASASAAKTAFDTAFSANSNADTRVSKWGDTMTGNLILNAKIGINTGTPLQPLHVQGQAFITSNLGIGSAGSNAFQALTVYGQSYFSSNVGIGNTQPVYPLDVVGTIRGSALTGSLITDSISTSNSTVAASASAAKTAFDTAFSANSNADTRVSKWGDTMTGNLILNAKIGINTGTPLQPLHVQGQAFITSNLGIGSAGSNAFQTLTVYGQSYFSSNVGIGNTQPVYPLDVVGTIRGSALTGSLITDSISTSNSTVAASASAAKTAFDTAFSANSNADTRVSKWGDTMTGNLILNAKIGINTGTPLQPLHVQGQAFITSNLGIGSAGSNAFQPLTVYGQSYFSSNMGIGTTFAKRTLDVQGDINFSGGLYQNNALYISSQWTSNTSTNSLYYNGSVGIGSTQPRSALDVAGTIYGTNLTISNSIITSNLTVQGTQTIVNTYTTYTSNLTIDNQLGSGPALLVLQKGAGGQYPVADFYDRDVSTTVPALRIADGANVGIGTGTPLQTLHIQGNTYISSNVGIGSTQPIQALDLVGTALVSTSIGIGTKTALLPLHVQGNSYTSGSVGIGTTNPRSKLHIYGYPILGGTSTDAAPNRFLSILDSAIVPGDSKYITFGKANSKNNQVELSYTHQGDGSASNFIGLGLYGNLGLTINGDGNIGIGTFAPNYKLHLNGDSYLNGSITTNSNNIDAGTGTITAATFAGTATQVSQTLIRGNYLTGSNYNGAITTIWDVDATTTSTSNKLVARDALGYIFANGVGIGTTNPTHSIHIYTTTSNDNNYESAGILLENGTAGEVGIAFRNSIVAADGSVWVMGLNSNSTRLDFTYGNLSNQLNTNDVKLSLDTRGTLTTSNLVILGQLSVGPGALNTNIQVKPTRQTFYVSGTTQSAFNIWVNGLFGGSASNVQVYLGQKLLTYYNATYKDYDLTVSTDTSNTLYQVNLTTPAIYGDFVDITVWPQLIPASPSTSSLYQTFNYITQYISSNISNNLFDFGTYGNIYTNSNVGIGTTNPLQALHVQGNAYASGSVGIGSTQPRNALDVAGYIYGTNLQITNSIITSNLTVQGTQTIVNTYTTYTSNLTIDNQLGSGPALLVLQKGAGGQYPVADFYDRDVSTTIPALRIADGANVGIGTTNPLSKLNVGGDLYQYLYTPITLSGNSTFDAYPFKLHSRQGSSVGPSYNALAFATMTNDATAQTPGATIQFRRNGAQGYGILELCTKDDTVALAPVLPRITLSGSNVGINNTNPTQILHVNGTTLISSGNLITSNSVGIGTFAPQEKLQVVGNVLMTGSFPQLYLNGAGTTCGLIKFNVQRIAGPSTSYSTSGARIVLYDSANGSTNYGGCIGIESGHVWYGAPNTGDGHKFYTGGTNQIIINNNGLFLANTPKLYGGSSTSYNSIEFSTTDGSITTYFGPNTTSRSYRFALQNDRNVVLYDGVTSLWNTGTSTSDSNLKDNIVPTQQNATEIIKSLNVVDFTWKQESVLNDGGKVHTGFIAQEVEKIIPDAIYTPSNNGSKLLHKEDLVPYLTKALQEALERIDALEKTVATLMK